MRGHFNCNECSGPPDVGRPKRRGEPLERSKVHVITLQFLDPHNLRNYVFGYNVPFPHLKAAGTPVRL
jgi:hypothetical protein